MKLGDEIVNKKIGMIQAMAGAAMLSSLTYTPILARDYLGIDELFITIIVGSYATAAFISSYIFGRAGDVYSRRVVLQFGLCLSTISIVILILVTTPEALFLVRILNGFCIGMYPGSLAAYAYDKKIKMGRFASFGAVGWGIGTVFAGIAGSFGIYYTFFLSSIFYAFAFVSALTLPALKRTKIKVPWFPVETFKRNYLVYLSIFIRHGSASALWTLWSLFLVDLGGDYIIIGFIQATNSISQFVFMIILTDRLDSNTLISAGLLATMINFVGLALVTNIMQVFITQVILGLSWACLYVGSLKFVTENNEDRSTASGLLASMISLASVIGPVITLILYSIWPSYIPLILNAALMSLIAFVFFRISIRETSLKCIPTISK
jgi:MFS family permease